MSVKEDNEITVRVLCPFERLENDLLGMGFLITDTFSMDDYYLVPKDMKENDPRAVLSKAVVIRSVTRFDGSCNKKIVFKKKEISESGDILSQSAYQCEIVCIEDSIRLFREIGYDILMNIKENDTVFSKDSISLAVKDVENLCLLIEFETNDAFDSIDKLKNAINGLNIDIDTDDYFVKKAEEYLKII